MAVTDASGGRSMCPALEREMDSRWEGQLPGSGKLCGGKSKGRLPRQGMRRIGEQSGGEEGFMNWRASPCPDPILAKSSWSRGRFRTWAPHFPGVFKPDSAKNKPGRG